MRSARAVIAWCCLISFFCASVVSGSASAQPMGPPSAPPPPPIPVAEQAPPPGQLMVRVALPPGTYNASLFLNETFAAWLQGGVLPAPLVLLPGGYTVRASAPGLRSYETTIELAPGQLLEISGALVADQPVVAPIVPLAPLVPGSAPPPPSMKPMKPARSFTRTYQSVIWGIGLTALGLAVVGGIAIGIACGASKCKSSRHDD